MAPKEQQIAGSVRSQDLSVSWISESGMLEENTDRVCILMMANGQVRLTMQNATLNLKGMRLTKGHVCVFAIFEACDPRTGDAADKASEVFMNMIMKYDITKRPAEGILRKCLSKVNKEITKKNDNACYKASVAAFAAKDLTVCSVNGGKLFVSSGGNKISEIAADGIEISHIGNEWNDVMMVSDGYPAPADEISDDMKAPTGDLITKRELRSLPDASSLIRAHRI